MIISRTRGRATGRQPRRRGHAQDDEVRQAEGIRAAQHAAPVGRVRPSAPSARPTTRRREEYGDPRRASAVAWSAVKHSFEKVGDHWEKKAGGRKGPSDKRAEQGRGSKAATKGGVDANATKEHLLQVARRLDISGRSTMKKKQLVDAIQKASTKKTADARKK